MPLVACRTPQPRVGRVRHLPEHTRSIAVGAYRRSLFLLSCRGTFDPISTWPPHQTRLLQHTYTTLNTTSAVERVISGCTRVRPFLGDYARNHVRTNNITAMSSVCCCILVVGVLRLLTVQIAVKGRDGKLMGRPWDPGPSSWGGAFIPQRRCGTFGNRRAGSVIFFFLIKDVQVFLKMMFTAMQSSQVHGKCFFTATLN